MDNMKNLYLKSENNVVIDEKERLVLGVVGSSGIIDRQGESVNPMGWQLDNFLKNPVVLYGHNYDGFPVGKAIKVWIEDNKLKFNLQFADTEEGLKTFKLIKDGYLNATSVGFIPKKFGVAGQDPYTIMEQELLELSIVPVPANPEALANDKEKYIWYKSLENKIKKEDKKEEIKEEKKSEKSPACRLDDETKEECVARKIPEILEENPDMEQDQAVAIANSMCDKLCSEKKQEPIQKEGRVLSEKNRNLIENAITQMEEAISALKDLLKATEPREEEEEKKEVKIENILISMRDLLRNSDKKIGLQLRELNQILSVIKK